MATDTATTVSPSPSLSSPSSSSATHLLLSLHLSPALPSPSPSPSQLPLPFPFLREFSALSSFRGRYLASFRVFSLADISDCDRTQVPVASAGMDQNAEVHEHRAFPGEPCVPGVCTRLLHSMQHHSSGLLTTARPAPWLQHVTHLNLSLAHFSAHSSECTWLPYHVQHDEELRKQQQGHEYPHALGGWGKVQLKEFCFDWDHMCAEWLASQHMHIRMALETSVQSQFQFHALRTFIWECHPDSRQPPALEQLLDNTLAAHVAPSLTCLHLTIHPAAARQGVYTRLLARCAPLEELSLLNYYSPHQQGQEQGGQGQGQGQEQGQGQGLGVCAALSVGTFAVLVAAHASRLLRLLCPSASLSCVEFGLLRHLTCLTELDIHGVFISTECDCDNRKFTKRNHHHHHTPTQLEAV